MSLDVGALYERYWEPVCRFLRRKAPDLTDADIEDVAAVVFEKAARAAIRNTYQEQGTPHSWLFMIARRALLDYWRAQKVRPVTDEITNDAPGGRATSDAGSQVHLTQIEVAVALDRLTDRQRIALVDLYWAGANQDETSLLLGISPGGLRHLRKRARTRLYSLLIGAA